MELLGSMNWRCSRSIRFFLWGRMEISYLHKQIHPSPGCAGDATIGISEGAAGYLFLRRFSFTLLVADTGRLKTRENSRAIKVMFCNSVFEDNGMFSKTARTGPRCRG